MHLVAILLTGLLALPAATASTEEPAPVLDWELVSRRSHDAAAFTQGLVADETGRLFESTGLWGESTLREVDALTGSVTRERPLPEEHFGEGLALVGDRLIGLTWRAGIATAYDVDTFQPLQTFDYEGEGWGLCFDGERLVMSDGSDELTFRDPTTFAVLDSVTVTLDGRPLEQLNELECVGRSVWANVWHSDAIVRIDPANGQVDGILDLRGILEPHPLETDRSATLNGIAHDAEADTFLVTGKRWPELIEIRLLAPDAGA